MDAQRIIQFLRDLSANNNRPWFQEHKSEYEAVKAEWEQAVEKMLQTIVSFDQTIANLQVKDCTYRFYRDTRFSPDKSPYKNHLGAFINAKGKKSLRGGYYIHMEPDHCLLAVGNYWLPTNILTACRNEIMANEAEWLKCVDTPDFHKFFDAPDDATWETSPQGFGMMKLKSCPAGFPRDYEHIQYLQLKDYCAWHVVPYTFFEGDRWPQKMARVLKAGKPMMDFINAVVDDYE